jgi:dihydrofolate reductase
LPGLVPGRPVPGRASVLTAGKNMMIMGSSALTVNLMRMGLVDEVRIMVNPVILGDGKSLFRTAERTSLTLLETRSFRSGNVLLRYQPAAR